MPSIKSRCSTPLPSVPETSLADGAERNEENPHCGVEICPPHSTFGPYNHPRCNWGGKVRFTLNWNLRDVVIRDKILLPPLL
ncbi:hypothetical protein CDAR_312811 [Caerostris darwini]|uniref:Uncharacterized protein n=1 Tax=Caerostris darwini TaxID=1538125 RepID=A0AAV4MSZ3_9ARAC|nr:hypothetical protein CDAR_312811 [Caerostris darwini]